MKRSKIIALSAISSAFSILFLTAGVFLSVLDYSAIFMASLCTMLPLAKKSWKGGVFTYFGTLLLALIFFVGVRPEIVLTYGIFFGLHPTVNFILREKNFNKIIGVIIKTVWFVASLLLVYWLFSGFLFEESLLNNEIFKKYAYIIISAVGAVLFIAYDFLMMRFQAMMDKTIEKLKL
ncbi:MAG: hypothetical protein E7360_00530 [Clostridiales bacterium]|nr:hypothetical protein [Clostridiales bacterium]